jgi:Protein of unknown function (DUF4245)
MDGMAKSRLRTTIRDMILSLAVIGVPIAVVLAIEPSKAGNPVHVIDSASFQGNLDAARATEPFAVLAPTGLPASWRATSESYQQPGAAAADWHVGYLTPSGGFAELEQTTESIAGFLNDQHSDAAQVSSVQVDGATWQRYTGTTPPALKNLLVRSDGKSTVIVAGSAPIAELEQFIGSLRTS